MSNLGHGGFDSYEDDSDVADPEFGIGAEQLVDQIATMLLSLNADTKTRMSALIWADSSDSRHLTSEHAIVYTGIHSILSRLHSHARAR